MRITTGDPEALRTRRFDRRRKASHRWRAWLIVGLAMGLLAATLWLCQTQVERWVLRATFRATGNTEAKRIDDRFVGRWIAPDGARLLISRSAVVWFEGEDLIGSGSFDDQSRFTFEGPGFRCRYEISIQRDVSDWRLLDHTPATSCPEGRFVRSFTF